MNCRECRQLLQHVLDGDPPEDRFDLERHLADCPGCRNLHAAAQVLEGGLRFWEQPGPPAYLAGRIVEQVLAERRARVSFRRRLVASAAAAAAVAAVVVLGSRQFRPEVHVPGPLAVVPEGGQVPATPSLNEGVEEAGTALVSLMGRTADETLGEGRLLLPADVPSPPLANAVAFQKTWDTPVRTFREAGQGVSTGLEPIATSARRAVNLFLKEIPDDGRDPGRKAG